MYSIAWPRAAIYTTVLNYTRLGRSLGPLGGLITERPNWFSASSAFILLTSTVVTVVTWVYSDHPPQWLPAGSASGSSAGIVFTHVPVLRFFAPQGRHVAPINVKFGRVELTVGPLLPAKFHLDRLRGGGLRTLKLKKWNFTNIIAPEGRVPYTIFTKFAEYMRVLSLYKFAKFGCFISINNKIINNLLRWGRFQPNFRRPLAAKLWSC